MHGSPASVGMGGLVLDFSLTSALEYVKDRDGLGSSLDLESEGEVSDPGCILLYSLLWQRMCASRAMECHRRSEWGELRGALNSLKS